MRSLTALVGLATLASALGTPSDYGSMERDIENLQSRAGPNRTTQCPFFFRTDPNFLTGTGVAVNQTSGVVSPSVFGSLLDSVHYQLTFQKMNWGRNTWIQHRFLSNVQDLPISNVTVCNMLFSYSPNQAQYEPEFEGRVKYSPGIKGSQPQIEINNNVSLPWSNATASGQGFKTVCVTVPWVKAKGNQKVNFLYSSNVCSTAIVWKGWVEFDNPFNTLYAATAPDRCFANQASSSPNNYNSIRTYGTNNLKIPTTCNPSTCTPGVNCKGRAAGGPKKNEPNKQ